jgi:hypothetical protein
MKKGNIFGLIIIMFTTTVQISGSKHTWSKPSLTDDFYKSLFQTKTISDSQNVVHKSASSNVISPISRFRKKLRKEENIFTEKEKSLQQRK